MNIKLSRTYKIDSLTKDFYFIFGLVTILVLIYIAFFFDYSQKHLVNGVIRTGNQSIIRSNNDGIIEKILVKSQQNVSKGTPLFSLITPPIDHSSSENGTTTRSDRRSSYLESIKIIENEIAANKLEINRITKEAEINTRINNEATLNSLKLLKQAEARIAITTGQINQLEILVKNGSARKIDLDKAKIELLNFQTNLQSTIQNSLQLENTKNEIIAVSGSKISSIGTLIANLKIQLTELNERIIRFDSENETTIFAQQDGKIDSLIVRAGDYVGRESPLGIMSFPDLKNDIQITIYIPNQYIATFDPNLPIYLRISSFPYETFGQLKTKILHIPSSGIYIKDEKGINSLYYPVELKVTENQKNKIPLSSLQDGMELSGNISQPPISIIRWLFLPIQKAYVRNLSQ